MTEETEIKDTVVYVKNLCSTNCDPLKRVNNFTRIFNILTYVVELYLLKIF